MTAVTDAPEHVIHVLNHEGDSRHIWDPAQPAEVKAARDLFDSLKKKGYLAYSVRSDGEPGKLMREFDPQAAKVIMRPQLVGG